MKQLCAVLIMLVAVLALYGCPRSEPAEPWVAPDGTAADSEVTVNPAEDTVVNEDAPVGEQCGQIVAQYQALLGPARACTGTLDCAVKAEHTVGCGCAAFLSDGSVNAKLAPLVEKYNQLNCMGDIDCAACPWLEIPECQEGKCVAVSPGCDGLAELYGKVLGEARVCESTDQCTGEVQSSFDCQCPYPISEDVWDGFFTTARQLWDFQGCPLPSPCTCSGGDPVCHDGVCTLTSELPAGSTECTGGSQCIPVSGCACGCWSQPPENDDPDVCPCAAPQSCVCYNGNCAQPQDGLKNCATDDDCIPVGNCDCGCWSNPPVSENSAEGPMCDCGTPDSCLCLDGKCLEIW